MDRFALGPLDNQRSPNPQWEQKSENDEECTAKAGCLRFLFREFAPRSAED